MRGIGRVGRIHEQQHRGRIGLGFGHQRQQRPLQESFLRGGIGLGRHHLRPLPDKADPAQQLGHRILRVVAPEALLDKAAHRLGRLVEPARQLRLQDRHLRLVERRGLPLIGQMPDPGAAAGGVQAPMRVHRLGLDKQRLGHALGRPAVIKQQQSVQPTMHRAVQLPAHQGQEIPSILRR